MEMLYSVVIYGLTFISSTFFIWVSERKKRKRRKWKFWAFIALFIPSVTAAFRESGVDFWTYKEIYYYIHGGGAGYTEWGWNLLNKVSPTHKTMLFCAAFIFLYAVYMALDKLVHDNKAIAWFSFLIIQYTTFFNGMRQMLAVAFVFWAMAFLFERKYAKSVILILIGASFHKTAYFVIILLWLYYLLIKRRRKIGWIVVALSIAALILAPVAIAVVGKMGIFSKYFLNDQANISLGFLLYLLPPLFFYYYKRSIFTSDKLNHYLAIYLLSIPFQVLGFRITYADRFMWFTQIFIVVLVPMIVSEYKKIGSEKTVRFLYYAWFVFHHIVIGIIMNGNAIYPYRVFG